MKNSIQFKIFILSILIIIPIGILYFNLGEDLFINIKENLENNKNYINICNPSNAKFYSTGSNPITPIYKNNSGPDACKYQCDLSNCDLYLINTNSETEKCKMYNFTEIGRSLNQNQILQVNCSNKNLPSYETNYNYLGDGYVDKNFYNANKDKFIHIDYLLDKANEIKTDYININQELNRLKGTADKRDNLNGIYTRVNNELNNLADYLDLSRNYLYSHLVDGNYSISNNNIQLGNKDFSYINLLNEFNKKYDESSDLESRIINDNLEYDRKYLVYTILTILMIISVIILVTYKLAPDLFRDSFIITYFIGVLLLVFFIHNYFKI